MIYEINIDYKMNDYWLLKIESNVSLYLMYLFICKYKFSFIFFIFSFIPFSEFYRKDNVSNLKNHENQKKIW